MTSDVSRDIGAAIRWVVVGVAIGVLPTYVMMAERAKKESAAAAREAAGAAAASVYAAWSATPAPVCPPPVMQMPTVVAVTGNGNGNVGNANATPRPTRVNAPSDSKDQDEEKAMMPMLNMMQGMMQNGDPGSGGATPDMNELMKNLPKK